MSREVRPVVGATDYSVSDDGMVWSNKYGRNRLLRPFITENGYARVGICYPDGRRRAVGIHILVAEAFIGPRPSGYQCRHLDGDPSNNRYDNLAWGTAKENCDDRRRHGRDRNPRPRVPQEVVDSIKDVYFCEKCNATITKMAEALGLSREYVSNVINGKVRSNG